jgi:hypothetical protein
MFYEWQLKQFNPSSKPATLHNRIKLQDAVSFLKLWAGLTAGLFIAGIAVPTLLRSEMATHFVLAAGSLRTLTIGRITFMYTSENLGFAILGGLVGAAIALAIEFPNTLASATQIFRKALAGR